MTRQKRYLRFVVFTLIAVFLVASLKNLPRTQALENGVARTPPMGWNSWNNFSCNLTPQLVEQTADVIVSTGMRDAGYVFVNLDDCWQDWRRTEDEHIVLDPDFQSPAWEGGMKALADYVHSKGLKLGLYSERGSRTCQGRMGSWGFETIDAQDYAAWGADYLKYDNCNLVGGSTMEGDDRNMLTALLASGRNIVFSLCNWLFYDFEPNVGNLWRTTGDISASWTSIMSLYDQNVQLAAYAKPGAWNDPDMLEVGRGTLTLAENRSHFGLWSIMAAPLLTGNDLRVMTDTIKAILMNPEIIAVDQDPLGIQGVKVRDDGNYEVLAKVLQEPSARAVALLNRASLTTTIAVNWSEIGLPAGQATVRDLWTHTDLGTFTDGISMTLGTHDTAMLKIVSLEAGPTVVPPPPPTRTPVPTPTATPTTVPKQDPVVWYKFDQTSGTTVTDSMGYRNATLTSGPTWVTGHDGNAVNLDGTNDYVNIPNPTGGSGLFRWLSEFTVAGWVQLDAAKTRASLWNFGTGTWIYMYLEPNSSTNTVRFGMTLWRDTYYTQHVDSASALPAGGWHHVAVTKAGKTAILYVDGDEVGRNSNMWLTPYNLGNTSQNYIGRAALYATSPIAPYLDGQVDDFRVYNRALSKSEIRSFGNVPPSVSNSLASQSVQYSDPIQTVTIAATDIASDVPLLSALTQWSVDGGVFQSGLPSGLTLTRVLPCTADGMYGTCTWTLEGKALVKPGTYVVRTTVSDGLATSNTDVTIVVTPEDARAYYNGNYLFWTSSVNSTSANVVLSAAILDITAVPDDPASDPYAGDIRNAKVTFVDMTTGMAFANCASLSVGLVDPSDLKTGTAMCNTTLTASNTGASQYTVGVVVTGYYTTAASADVIIVTVAQPIPSNFITGGGYLVLSSSSGMVPGTAGSKTNFGFNVKYNKSGTNLQGHVNIIVRSGGHVYQIKSTAISSLGVAETQANFSGKANITDITDPLNPITIEGNATLQMWTTDNGEPGTSDTLGIQLLNKDGGTWFTSNWNGTKTVEQTLGGGNLSVH